ncbi:hypothetical protein [Sphingorhabdus sp. 109]|uniref:hypothetical protein n=1 Tax=Sphingorhabdus sp. 109 TaxID=2653173 RepID=UPI0012EF74DE|nr:hypothetical protein [Sphingorhabdus sp. 109]VWX56691.1 hypothetical protein SPHINGOR109_10545 [Sphingorhabdus sp. 109]
MLNTESLFPHAGSFAMRRNRDNGKYDIPVRILRRNPDGSLLIGDPVPGGKRRNAASINCNVPIADLLPTSRQRCLRARHKHAFQVSV